MLKNSILISYKWTPKFPWVEKRHHLGFALIYSSKSKTRTGREIHEKDSQNVDNC